MRTAIAILLALPSPAFAVSHLLTFDAHATLAGLMDEPVTVFPTGTPADCRGDDGSFITAGDPLEARGFGAGGGAGGRVGYMLSSLNAQSGVWGAFRGTTGLDVLYMHRWAASSLKCHGTAADLELRPEYTSAGGYFLHIPIHIGGVLGLGSARPGGKWSGVAIGLAYAPSVVIMSSGVSLYFAGVELSFDILVAKSVTQRDPNFRIALLVLPPLSGLPLYGNLSFGAVWY